MMNFVSKTRNCVLKTMDFVSKTRNCVLKTMDFLLKMMNSADQGVPLDGACEVFMFALFNGKIVLCLQFPFDVFVNGFFKVRPNCHMFHCKACTEGSLSVLSLSPGTKDELFIKE